MLDEAVRSQELNSMALVNPFKLGMFYDSMILLLLLPKETFLLLYPGAASIEAVATICQ